MTKEVVRYGQIAKLSLAQSSPKIREMTEVTGAPIVRLDDGEDDGEVDGEVVGVEVWEVNPWLRSLFPPEHLGSRINVVGAEVSISDAPNYDPLHRIGPRPETRATTRMDGEYYQVYSFHPGGVGNHSVLVEILDEESRAARVISSFRGRENDPSFKHGEIIIMPGDADLQLYTTYRRNKSKR